MLLLKLGSKIVQLHLLIFKTNVRLGCYNFLEETFDQGLLGVQIQQSATFVCYLLIFMEVLVAGQQTIKRMPYYIRKLFVYNYYFLLELDK